MLIHICASINVTYHYTEDAAAAAGGDAEAAVVVQRSYMSLDFVTTTDSRFD